jgi:amino acid transporter
MTVFILVLFSAICLFGIRESSKVALTIMSFHILTMFVIAITSMVRWGINGNSTLSDNWHAAQPHSTTQIVKQIFFGVSLAFLGNTGIPPLWSED